MNSIVAQMTGRKDIREDGVPVPVGMPRSPNPRARNRRSVQRRTAATLMGLREADKDEDDEEDEESIIPDDAEEIKNIAGVSGIRLDDKPLKKDREPEEPDSPTDSPDGEEDHLLSPRDALVAPDVTPQALEPLDASEVPQGREQPQVPRFMPSRNQEVNPMDVLLGRTSTRPARPEQPVENVVTVEAAQAAVNSLLNAEGVSGEALLRPKTPMPDPQPGNASKIMEAFDKYGPPKSWYF
jgi:hypothetical protein